MADLLWFILFTVYGAVVGSFLNVVIYRLPEGKSLLRPASHCPRCGHGLAWYDNVPVLGWLFLRGKCRYCKAPISIQYPLIEALTAALFAGLFAAYYYAGYVPAFSHGFDTTWPALVVRLCLVAALLAATIIDARYYIIPLGIPWTAALIAVVVLPCGTIMYPNMEYIGPSAPLGRFNLLLGAVAGLAVAWTLLRLGWIPRSFDEPESDAPPNSAGSATEQKSSDPKSLHGTPEEWLAHPHPRREVLKELLFVGWPVFGALLADAFLPAWSGRVPFAYQPALMVLAGVLQGFFVGGALVWIVRILGTLAFGKEAMGLGDVHLLAGIGAVVGALGAVIVFFVAPFFGLLAVLVAFAAARFAKGEVRVIPFGPYLAAAAAVILFFYEPINHFLQLNLGFRF